MEYEPSAWLIKWTAIIWCSVGFGIGILFSLGFVIIKNHIASKAPSEKYTNAWH